MLEVMLVVVVHVVAVVVVRLRSSGVSGRRTGRDSARRLRPA